MRDLASSWRIVGVLQALDVMFVPLMILGWAALLAVEASVVVLPIAIVTGGGWMVNGWRIRSVMRPADAWREALAAGQHDRVHAAYTALQRGPLVAAIGYGVVCSLVLLVATAYVWAGMGEAAPIGAPELHAGLLIAAVALGSGNLALAVINALVRSEAPRSGRRRGGRAAGACAAILTRRAPDLVHDRVCRRRGLFMASVGWSNSAAFDRYHTLVTLDHVVSADLSRVAAGVAPAQAVIVDADAVVGLSPGAALDSLPRLYHRLAIDRRAGLAADSVAAPLADGRWLIVEAPVIPSRDGLASRLLLLFGLVVALAIPGTTVLTMRSLLGPLGELERVTLRLVEVGDVADIAHLSVVQDDEIGALTRSFNRLVHNLRGSRRRWRSRAVI